MQEQISNAVGSVMDSQQFTAQLKIAFDDPELQSCTIDSLYAAANTCSALGLLPTQKQIALIPRKNKGVLTCDVMPQWQGMKAIMMRNPEVLDINAFLVHATDEFEFQPNLSPPIRHNYDPFSEDRIFRNFDDVRGGYLVIEWRDRTRRDKYHFVSKDKMLKAKGCAQTSAIWDKWFEEQCLKTVYRNAFARQVIPIDFAVNRALERLIQAEDQLNDNDPQRVANDAMGITNSQPPVSRVASVANRLAVNQPMDVELEIAEEPEVIYSPPTDEEATENPPADLFSGQ